MAGPETTREAQDHHLMDHGLRLVAQAVSLAGLEIIDISTQNLRKKMSTFTSDSLISTPASGREYIAIGRVSFMEYPGAAFRSYETGNYCCHGRLPSARRGRWHSTQLDRESINAVSVSFSIVVVQSKSLRDSTYGLQLQLLAKVSRDNLHSQCFGIHDSHSGCTKLNSAVHPFGAAAILMMCSVRSVCTTW